MGKLTTQIRLNKVAKRQAKPYFGALKPKEKEFMKLILEMRAIDRWMGNFYNRVARLPDRSVDWKSLSAEELDMFDSKFKKSCQLWEKKERMAKKYGINQDYVESVFLHSQLGGTSFQ